ncbi:MAG: tRNA (adenosine(37)-N6)-threonylcarbamoyltransferase complex transferase subunit TsaD [Candidatus Latescibacterota bacterium]|nr:tRNA (adenosine(37)-N6)-threonylcarbamoyltransferase complex transferase subunit TsaD [Candidatus Latescibacterota bacterium]
MLVLGIETSCDETAAAVAESYRSILSNVIFSQQDHAEYGGVVPELASRAHVRTLLPVVERAIELAGAAWNDIDAIAVTEGPGLVGSLLVGVNVAKGLAYGRGIPLLGVHHLEGHIFSSLIDSDLEPPFVTLLVSGGHTELIHVPELNCYEMLGQTLDDAAGEAFDKVARLLDLMGPEQLVMGGKAVSEAAAEGDEDAIRFPRALPGQRGLDFSFSGLKTAVFVHLRDHAVDEAEVPDVAASFEQAVVDVLVTRTLQAVQQTGCTRVALVGGVASNSRLRDQMRRHLTTAGARLYVPELPLCTDNAAMIAVNGYFRLARGERSSWDLDARPRIPIGVVAR